MGEYMLLLRIWQNDSESGSARQNYSIDTNKTANRANNDNEAAVAELQITCTDAPFAPVQPAEKVFEVVVPVQFMALY
jgi:hypothetical protein